MYDFNLGSSKEIAADEMKYLIAIKRMMPRWINALPDLEFQALAEIIEERAKKVPAGKKFVMVETGAGASSLLLAFYALKYDGIAYSWDLNGEKGSLIRTVLTETMGNYFRKHVDSHWKLIAQSSLSSYLGLPLLKELTDHVDFFFHDSEHVWSTLKKELELIMPFLSDGAVIALDDANLDFLEVNITHVNTFRKKLGLPALPWPKGISGEYFYVATEKLLKGHWGKVEHIDDSYKKTCHEDIYYKYYNVESTMNVAAGMQRNENLEHRFESWRVHDRKI